MYHILEANINLKQIYHLVYANDSGWGTDFLSGQSVVAPTDKNDLYIEFECEEIELPDYFEAGGVPVANQKLIDAFDSLKITNYQALPTEIRFLNSVANGYYVFNVIGRIDCLDKEASDYSSFGPSIARIFNLQLKIEKIYDAAVFREHNYQDVIFVSEDLRDAIDVKNISGCKLSSAEGWSDKDRF